LLTAKSVDSVVAPLCNKKFSVFFILGAVITQLFFSIRIVGNGLNTAGNEVQWLLHFSDDN